MCLKFLILSFPLSLLFYFFSTIDSNSLPQFTPFLPNKFKKSNVKKVISFHNVTRLHLTVNVKCIFKVNFNKDKSKTSNFVSEIQRYKNWLEIIAAKIKSED